MRDSSLTCVASQALRKKKTKVMAGRLLLAYYYYARYCWIDVPEVKYQYVYVVLLNV